MKKYGLLHKNRTRQSDRQLQLEIEFSALLDKLFDVAHANCEKNDKN